MINKLKNTRIFSLILIYTFFPLGDYFIFEIVGQKISFAPEVKTARAATVANVTILADGNFSPKTVSITAGDQIKWTNTSEFEEEPASDAHPTHLIYPALNVGPVAPDGTVTSPALTQVGTWDYHNHACGASCAGTIIISAASPAAYGGTFIDLANPVLVSQSLTVNHTKAMLRFKTEEAALFRVEFGTTTAYSDGVASTSEVLNYDHAILLENLLAGTTYYFRIFTQDRLGNKGYSYANQFTTLQARTEADADLPVEITIRLPENRMDEMYHWQQIYGFRFERTLLKGARGKDVENLQIALIHEEVYPEALVTGYFGPLTQAAVKRFQKKYGIENIGIVGPKTKAKLNEILNRITEDEGGHSQVSAASGFQIEKAPPIVSRPAGTAVSTTVPVSSEEKLYHLREAVDALKVQLDSLISALKKRTNEEQVLETNVAKIVEVVITDSEFAPKIAVINKGDRIRWVNKSDFPEEPAALAHWYEDETGKVHMHDQYPEINGPNKDEHEEAVGNEIPPGGERVSLPLNRAGWWGYHNHAAGESWLGIIIISDPITEKPILEELQALVPLKTLKRGDRGEEVRKLQKLLSYNSAIYPEGLVTGYYGSLTQEAVEEFQDAFAITDHAKLDQSYLGKVDDKTLEKLKEIFEI